MRHPGSGPVQKWARAWAAMNAEQNKIMTPTAQALATRLNEIRINLIHTTTPSLVQGLNLRGTRTEGAIKIAIEFLNEAIEGLKDK